MRTLLICHSGESLNQVGLARWLASFSELAGIVVIQETRQRLLQRIRRGIRRVGLTRFLDVMAFGGYYRLRIAWRDRQWEQERLSKICERYAGLKPSMPILQTSSPNSREAAEFIRTSCPD